MYLSLGKLFHEHKLVAGPLGELTDKATVLCLGSEES